MHIMVDQIGRRMKANCSRLGAVMVITSLLVSCSNLSSPAGDDATGYVGRVTGSPQASSVGVASAVVDLMPNRLFHIVDDNYSSNSDTVVVGMPTLIEPGVARVWSGSKDDKPVKEVAFDDPAAETRTWLVTIKVEEVIAGQSPAELIPSSSEGELRVKLVSGGGAIDVNAYVDGIKNLERSVWFLKVRRDWNDSFAVAWRGRAVAKADEAGRLSYPFIGSGESSITEGAKTVEDLRELGRKPASRVRPGN
ncbi:MAG: hypothetical protein ABIP03_04100 [Aquihabitans sp.]